MTLRCLKCDAALFKLKQCVFVVETARRPFRKSAAAVQSRFFTKMKRRTANCTSMAVSMTSGGATRRWTPR